MRRDWTGDLCCINCGHEIEAPKPVLHRITTQIPPHPTVSPEVQAMRRMITDYLRAHPGASTAELADHFGVKHRAMSNRLNSMYTSHLVTQEEREARTEIKRWYAIGDGE